MKLLVSGDIGPLIIKGLQNKIDCTDRGRLLEGSVRRIPQEVRECSGLDDLDILEAVGKEVLYLLGRERLLLLIVERLDGERALALSQSGREGEALDISGK